jgi:hypothetical protein
MFWGFALTAAALGLMVVWALIEIFRIDRIIEKVDRDLDGNSHKPAGKK